MTIMKEQFLTFAKYLLTNPYANYESVPKIASALGLSESEVKDILSVIYISQNYIGKLDTLEHNKLKPINPDHLHIRDSPLVPEMCFMSAVPTDISHIYHCYKRGKMWIEKNSDYFIPERDAPEYFEFVQSLSEAWDGNIFVVDVNEYRLSPLGLKKAKSLITEYMSPITLGIFQEGA